MAKIVRKNMKVFASSAGFQQLAQIGSLAANAPVFSTDPEVLQALSNYIEGWNSVVIGENSPAIEDMNSLCYVYAYQLAYIMQTGVPEWNALTTYYIGSIVQDGTGILFASLTNTNLNNALTSTANWRSLAANEVSTSATSTTLVMGDSGKTFLCNSASAAMAFILPAPAANLIFTFKDATGSSPTHAITINQHASETIDGQASLIIDAQFGSVSVISDGTNWFINNSSRMGQFFISNVVTTESTPPNTSTTAFTTLVNSPAFTFTPKLSGVYRVWSPATIQQDTAPDSAVFRIFNTSGGATLLAESQAVVLSTTQLYSCHLESIYMLTANVTYVMDIQSLNLGGGQSYLRGDNAQFFMFAMYVGG